MKAIAEAKHLFDDLPDILLSVPILELLNEVCILVHPAPIDPQGDTVLVAYLPGLFNVPHAHRLPTVHVIGDSKHDHVNSIFARFLHEERPQPFQVHIPFEFIVMVVHVWVRWLNWQGEVLADEACLHEVTSRRIEDAIADNECFLSFLFEVF
jgi:hypothetical protein